jgi:hypothetical protein
MERACATDCTSQTNTFFDNSNAAKNKVVINACCQSDYCNIGVDFISNKINVFLMCLIALFFRK